MRINLFLNGTMHQPESISKVIRPDDINIAVDGGARHCWKLGIQPAIAIGDFDSLNEDEIVRLLQEGAEMITYPKEKDQTDLELALELAMQRGADEVVILAGMGHRWDMTTANLLVLARPQYRDLHIRFVDNGQQIFCISEQTELKGKIGDTVSLLPLGGDAQGVSTTGLKYPLEDETLYFSESRGVSNLITAEKVSVSLKSGTLLCFLSKPETIQ